MPVVRTPNNNEEAAAFALLGLAKTTGGLAVWISWLAAIFLPAFLWPLRYGAKSVPKRARLAICFGDHGIAVVGSIGCVAALYLTLLKHLFHKREWFRDAVCASDPLKDTFANNHLVGWLAATLVFLVIRMFALPFICAICRTTGLGFLGRLSNASHVGAVWWLMIEHSPLAFLQALVVCLDTLFKHALCLTQMRFDNQTLQRRNEFVASVILSILSMIALVYGGIAYSSRCDADKRHGSLIVVLHWVRCWTLLREVLRFAIEHQTFKKLAKV